MDRRSIAGLAIDKVTIRDSFSGGLTVVGPGSAKGEGTLAEARLKDVTVDGVGLEGPGRHGLWVRGDARGGLTLIDAKIADIRNDSTGFSIRNEAR